MNPLGCTMDEQFQIDRRRWKKYLFYVDAVVWAILAAAVAYVIGNVYLAGLALGTNGAANNDGNWWRVLTGFSFMMGALAWVFFRFWKNGFLALKRPF